MTNTSDGLNRLVEWLDGFKKDWGCYPTAIAIEDKAHRLLAEEQSNPRRECVDKGIEEMMCGEEQKPSAPANTGMSSTAPVICEGCHYGWGSRTCPTCSDYPKPTAQAGLVEELREWAAGFHSVDEDGRAERCPVLSKFDEILSRHEAKPAKEPLAVVAEKKGVYRTRTYSYCDSTWEIVLVGVPQGARIEQEIKGSAYAECEAKARAYLNGLPEITSEEGWVA